MPDNLFSTFTTANASTFIKDLMDNYEVLANDNAYRLLEVELYYYDNNNDHADKSVFERDTQAQQFFFHAFGVDICFETNKDKTCFGGVLIRAMRNAAGKLFCGPISCHDEILRKIKFDQGKSLLSLSLEKANIPQNIDIEETVRIKGKKDDFDDTKYRYVSKEFLQEIMGRKNSDYYRKRISSVVGRSREEVQDS